MWQQHKKCIKYTCAFIRCYCTALRKDHEVLWLFTKLSLYWITVRCPSVFWYRGEQCLQLLLLPVCQWKAATRSTTGGDGKKTRYDMTCRGHCLIMQGVMITARHFAPSLIGMSTKFFPSWSFASLWRKSSMHSNRQLFSSFVTHDNFDKKSCLCFYLENQLKVTCCLHCQDVTIGAIMTLRWHTYKFLLWPICSANCKTMTATRPSSRGEERKAYTGKSCICRKIF